MGEITDFMPVEDLYAGKELIRRVATIRGTVRYRMLLQPAFDYGRFPQAFTHLGLISAAFNLNEQLNDSRNKNVNRQ